jgi:hypothetical protein
MAALGQKTLKLLGLSGPEGQDRSRQLAGRKPGGGNKAHPDSFCLGSLSARQKPGTVAQIAKMAASEAP